MNATQTLLEAGKRRNKIESDYRQAKILGIDPQRMSKYVTGAREIEDDELVAKAAQLAGRDPLETVAKFAAARARTEGGREVWAGMLEAVKLAKARVVKGKMVGRVGIEPTTNWLKASCSTD